MSWSLVVDAGLLSLFLLLASLLRKRFSFFAKFLIPVPLVAGFLLLPVYEYLGDFLHLSRENLGEMTYHLFNISFVAIVLRKRQPMKRAVASNTFAVFFQYGLQACIGLLMTLGFVFFVYPRLSLGFGLLLPLGFALGPGTAFSIGKSWEALGFADAASLGVFFASAGFFVSSFVGVGIINWGRRKKLFHEDALTASREASRTQISQPGKGAAIDSMTFHLSLVVGIYALTYLLLTLLTNALAVLGDAGDRLANNLWGLAFLFASLTGLGVKGVLRLLRLDGIFYSEHFSRIAGSSMDYVIVSAIAGISVSVITQYWIPLLSVVVVGSVLTTVSVLWVCSRLYSSFVFQRMLVIFGVSTGTLATGVSLLRVVDPELATPAAPDYMYAMGLNFVVAIPFILSMNLPIYSRLGESMTGFWAMLGISVAYMIVCFFFALIIAGRIMLRKPSRIWLNKKS